MMPARRVYLPPPHNVAPQPHRLEPSRSTRLQFAGVMGQRSPSAGGNIVEFRLRNPLNSGFFAFVTKVTAWANTTRGILGLTLGAGLSDLVTTVAVASRRRPPESSAMRLSTQNTNPSVTNPTNLFSRKVEANTPFIYPSYATEDPIAVIGDDAVFEVAFSDAGNVTTDVFTCDLEWYELPARVVEA